LIRRIKQIRGQGFYTMHCCPRFDYARTPPQITKKEGIFYFSDGKDLTLKLSSTLPIQKSACNGGEAFFTLQAGDSIDFILEMQERSEENVDMMYRETIDYWRTWASQSKYKGRWQETVNRSALTLKLLTSYDYGAIVAAPTFGLPESIGGSLNWDYRYNWMRDSAFALYALMRLGYTKEADHFIHWLHNLCEDINTPGGLGIMYSLSGKKNVPEDILDHLEGYQKSKPVRIGNAAHDQLQLDIIGELMDSIYLYDKYGTAISQDLWEALTLQINWLCDNWRRKDRGIWEMRDREEHLLFSRLLCWVGIDRGIRLANKRSFPMPPHWIPQRDDIYNSIFEDFWNPALQSFVEYPSAQHVDASILLMPLVRFISPRDEKWLGTLKYIEKKLVSDSLVYRYCCQDMPQEGTFSLCSFWYVECLSRAGQLEKARFYFEKMLGYANHLGLYAEQIGERGEQLGNFPQAFTHLGLISAAYDLNRRLDIV